jgi:hypothetical protein
MSLSLEQVLLFLKLRTALRLVVIVGFYGCIGMAIAKLVWRDQAVVHMPSYIALMLLLGAGAIIGGFLLRIGRCPRCGHLFAVRAVGKQRNNFTSQCLNCGLSLDGSNATEPL